MWNLFKVYNKHTRTTLLTRLTSFYCLYCQLWTYCTLCSGGSIVNFKHVTAGWEIQRDLQSRKSWKPCKSQGISSVVSENLEKLGGAMSWRVLITFCSCGVTMNPKSNKDGTKCLLHVLYHYCVKGIQFLTPLTFAC